MDRNREVRRATTMVTSNGLSRRRHRSSSLRDSPEEDGPVELQESVRLRERLKKERDRDRDRERDRERSSRSKRRRGERMLIHGGSNREDGGDETSEESVNDEDDDEDDEALVGGGATRLLTPQHNPSLLNHHHHHQNHINHHHPLQHRKSFPPQSGGAPKMFRDAAVRKSGDEMIGVSIPRKARSALTKRPHDYIPNNGGFGVGGEQIHRQASTSPVRQGLASTSSPSPAAPLSPSSSNASARKKIKTTNGTKPKLPKSSSSSKPCSSSNAEELEIEIAEVLYGLMTQSQGPVKKETPSEANNHRSISSDSRSRVSSPISNSVVPQSSPAVLVSNSATPMSAVAPKRKKPREVFENPAKIDQMMKVEAAASPPVVEKTAAENGDLHDLVNSHEEASEAEPMKVDSAPKPVDEEPMESLGVARKETSSPKEGSPLAVADNSSRVDAAITAQSSVSEAESSREDKFQIDLMALPPQGKSSPERDGGMDLGPPADLKLVASDVDTEIKLVVKKDMDDRDGGLASVEAEDKKVEAIPVEESGELHKGVSNNTRSINLQFDLEKPETEIFTGSSKSQPCVQKQLKVTKEEPQSERNGQQPNSLPLPMSMACWPGGMPPMGYMAPLQGVVAMDGSAIASPSIQPLFSQPRSKRCATHCYIARSIHYLQQLVKMNPLWPAAAGSAPLFGPKTCNLNVVPPVDVHGNLAGRAVQDKGQPLAIFPGYGGKQEKGGSQPDTTQKKQQQQQILLQQALPPVAPNNLLQGPAFIFHLNRQQAAVAAVSARPPPPKTQASATGGGVQSSNTSTSAASTTTPDTHAGVASGALSFNYPNLSANETQYLAILQNSAYHFPIPGMGAPPNYRGGHPQPMPLFNGPFLSSQMVHPSQLHQQPQTHQIQQAQQNANTSSGSSSSQKNLHSQQPRPQGSAVNGAGATGNLNNFPALKNRPPHHSQPPQNFALVTMPAAMNGGASKNEKQQQQQPQGLKSGVELLPPHTFAMSFAQTNGAASIAASGIDISSVGQSNPILHGLPEASRQNIQISAAAAAAAAAAASQALPQKKNLRTSDDVKAGGGSDASSAADNDRKGSAGKASASIGGQSLAFSRSDLTDATGSDVTGCNGIDSSGRSLNLTSVPSRISHSGMPNNVDVASVQHAKLQAQFQHQQQQMIQLHKQQQQQLAAAVATQTKSRAQCNGSVYPEQFSSSPSVASKFQNSLSAFPQNMGQTSNNSSPAQSPQWKSSARTNPSQAPSSLAQSSLKNLPQQQQARTQQSHTQISFGVAQKASAPQGQQQPSSATPSPSPSMMVGSPTTSMSKGASGSPRMTACASTSNKTSQASSLSTQQAKGPSSVVANQKSSPVGGRSISSILGNPHISSTSNSGSKPQMQQQQQQQQQHQKGMQQAQLFFSNPYMQAQSSHPSSTNSMNSATSTYYMQRRRPDQQQQPPTSSAAVSSTGGMLSLCPVTLGGSNTSDPAKAIAAAVSNTKGGGLSSQTIVNAAQFVQMPGGFSYVHPIPAAVQVKPAEQKQPAGNDNLHVSWQPEKK